MLLNDQFQYILNNYISNREIFQNTPSPRKEVDERWPVRRVIRMKDPNRFPDYKKMNIPCTIENNLAIISTKKDEKQYLIKGSSGEGNMSVSPWIGIFDKDVTTSARKEYAVVYLFDTKMNRFYLSLNQGWTQYHHSVLRKDSKTGKYKKGDYASGYLEFSSTNDAATAIKKNAKIAQNLINSSRGFSFDPISLSSEFDPMKGKVPKNKENLAWGYEMGNILSKCYEIDAIPSEEVLFDDLFKMLGIYRELKVILDNNSIVLISDKNNLKIKEAVNENFEDNESEIDNENDEKQHFVKSNAAITGNKAEDIFENEVSIEMGYKVKRVTDKVGLGYDFISDDGKTFFEIKGFKDEFGDFRLTETEWEVAKNKKDNYILILISNVFGDYHNSIAKRNPYLIYEDKIKKMKINPSYYYRLKKSDI